MYNWVLKLTLEEETPLTSILGPHSLNISVWSFSSLSYHCFVSSILLAFLTINEPNNPSRNSFPEKWIGRFNYLIVTL